MSPLKVYQLTAAKDPSGFGTVAFTDGVHMGHYSRFLQFFKSLEDNETRVKSWLENVRRPNTKISACIESGEVYDYVDQLKAVMEDMSMMLHKSRSLSNGTNFSCAVSDPCSGPPLFVDPE